MDENTKRSTCQADYVAGLTGINLPSAKAKHINKLTRHCQALKRPAMTGFSKHQYFTKFSNLGNSKKVGKSPIQR